MLTEQTTRALPAQLDTSRRYLVPVADEDGGTHLALYAYAPRVSAWVTGAGVCGTTTQQGALPAATPLTCRDCEALEEGYREMLEGRTDPHRYCPACNRGEQR
ncbi:hypothetical protein AB0D90_14660 [Streptomyces althioticus]|uniref:hypothetical protein n=1 Tax=Streptomyces althioticus TaxID=83380 RepID=UPI0033DD73FE